MTWVDGICGALSVDLREAVMACLSGGESRRWTIAELVERFKKSGRLRLTCQRDGGAEGLEGILAGIFRSKSIVHAANLDIWNPKDAGYWSTHDGGEECGHPDNGKSCWAFSQVGNHRQNGVPRTRPLCAPRTSMGANNPPGVSAA